MNEMKPVWYIWRVSIPEISLTAGTSSPLLNVCKIIKLPIIMNGLVGGLVCKHNYLEPQYKNTSLLLVYYMFFVPAYFLLIFVRRAMANIFWHKAVQIFLKLLFSHTALPVICLLRNMVIVMELRLPRTTCHHYTSTWIYILTRNPYLS